MRVSDTRLPPHAKARDTRRPANGCLTPYVVALLLSACATETRPIDEADPREALSKGGWKVEGNALVRVPDARPGTGARVEGGGGFFDVEERRPEDVVQVPLEAWEPLDAFFDNEGYLLGDRVEIDCSFQPFLARLVALAYADDSGKFVVREEKRVAGGHEVRLRNVGGGPRTVSTVLPRATFGSRRGVRAEDPRTGDTTLARIRPFFEVVATEEIVIRFHGDASADRPVFFRARAVGIAPGGDPGSPRDCVYTNVNRRRRAKGPGLDLSVEIRRDAAGGWATVIDDPGGRAAGTGDR